MQVFFITNRNPVPNNEHPTGFGKLFHPRGAGYLRVGYAHLVDPPPGQRAKDKPALQSVSVYPEMITPEPSQLGSTSLFADLEARVFDPAGMRDVLLYIHGFDTAFDEALQYTAQVAMNLAQVRQSLLDDGADLSGHSGPALRYQLRELVPIVLTWPSDGELIPQLSYWSDRNDAEASKDAVARVFLKLREYLDQRLKARMLELKVSDVRPVRDAIRAGELYCGVRIHLMAQSMGNFVLRHGLQAFSRHPSMVGRPLPRLFDQILLTGADEEDEAFQDKAMFHSLPDLGRRVSVYHTEGDLALMVSMTTKQLSNRLGRNGPKEIIQLANLEAIDVSAVLDTKVDTTNHYYGRLNPNVQMDMLYLMAGLNPSLVPGRQSIGVNRFQLIGR